MPRQVPMGVSCAVPTTSGPGISPDTMPIRVLQARFELATSDLRGPCSNQIELL
jgi:hypothetical protein